MVANYAVRHFGIVVCVLSVVSTITLLLTVVNIWQRANTFKGNAMGRSQAFATKSRTQLFAKMLTLKGFLALPSGTPGEPGTAGFPGTPGYIGHRGAHGDNGIRGPPGENAIAGEGIKGPLGVPGSQGAKGPPGTPGRPSNVRGAPGRTGSRGGIGATGKYGPYGERGSAGPPGEPGMPSTYCPSDCGVNTIISVIGELEPQPPSVGYDQQSPELTHKSFDEMSYRNFYKE
ncbi:hypothetical protein NECAME_08079 [Necator americanus]|uniref:Collagen triple helix repeat protein n=1 Tax=Necator americanus TaxID=51031 RepID=W2TJD1_NECAM|nr:hypothetical protein NECAME_08079 [Necator americanus]ETN82205.1 hypothetical protein NECAME_08079 [Necator americanus]